MTHRALPQSAPAAFLSKGRTGGASDTGLAALGKVWARATPHRPAHVPALFEELYREHFDFVFRCTRRLGVPEAHVDDAVQEVFLVVLRRLSDFRRDTSARTWLFSISARIAANQRRGYRRHNAGRSPLDADHPDAGEDPFELAARTDASRIVQEFLDQLSDDRRSLFIMAELEDMNGPEIAAALAVNLNTIYSRLRALRQEFANHAAALLAQDEED